MYCIFQTSITNASLTIGSSPFTNTPGPSILDTLDIPNEQPTTSSEAVRAMLANTTGRFVPVDQPDTPALQATSNEDEHALMALLSRIANSNNEQNELVDFTPAQKVAVFDLLVSLGLRSGNRSPTHLRDDVDPAHLRNKGSRIISEGYTALLFEGIVSICTSSPQRSMLTRS